jgi:N-acetylmuramoyl-L-alanine amidase|tara:strand:+ start:9232 stop:9642 length:411 start_codon:yes stop_codon:yes gene_type:complete
MLEGVSENIEYMARTIWGEARGEDEQGKIAVGHVIKNRRDKQTWMGKTIKDVCLKKWQFSCWNENDPNRNKILALKLNDLEDYLELSAKVISGMYDDPTKGSTHYYAKSMKSPPKWAEGKEPVYDHGGHLFFNDVK